MKNELLIKYHTELRLAEAKKRIEARELDNHCPDCERRYELCRCV